MPAPDDLVIDTVAAHGVYLHCDVDKMYFSVEALETPDLARDPRVVIVGLDPKEYPRAVVTTANSAAREIGINSGMSTAIAARMARERGLDVRFVRPRHELYGHYSRRLMDLLRRHTPLLEQRSIDEAAMDWTATGFGREPVVALRTHILEEIGLSVSFGVAPTLLVAKMASEVAKTLADHVCIVCPGESAAFLAPLSVRALVGVGPKSEARLRGLGLATIGELARQPMTLLVEQFGASYGRYLYSASRGEDDSTLVGEHAYKSVSAEHTFAHDTADAREIWRRLRDQALDVSERLRAEGLVAGEVAIKLRYGVTWVTITRQQRLLAPTAEAETLATGAAALMRKAWTRQPIRLIGLRAGKLEPSREAVQLALPG